MAINKDTKQILTYAAIVGGGYFLVLKPILVKLGILKSADELAQEAAQSKNLTVLTNYNNANLSKSIGEWQSIANAIYTNLKDLAVLDNVNDAIYQLCRVQTEDDVKALINCFGYRQVTAFGISYGSKLMLPQFITQSLSSSEINTVNNNYTRKNIKFRF